MIASPRRLRTAVNHQANRPSTPLPPTWWPCGADDQWECGLPEHRQHRRPSAGTLAVSPGAGLYADRISECQSRSRVPRDEERIRPPDGHVVPLDSLGLAMWARIGLVGSSPFAGTVASTLSRDGSTPRTIAPRRRKRCDWPGLNSCGTSGSRRSPAVFGNGMRKFGIASRWRLVQAGVRFIEFSIIGFHQRHGLDSHDAGQLQLHVRIRELDTALLRTESKILWRARGLLEKTLIVVAIKVGRHRGL